MNHRIARAGATAALALGLIATVGVLPSTAATSEGCRRFHYNVEQRAGVYDKAYSGSASVGTLHVNDQIWSYSVGSKFVRVDLLLYPGGRTDVYDNDYVAKFNLRYIGCD